MHTRCIGAGCSSRATSACRVGSWYSMNMCTQRIVSSYHLQHTFFVRFLANKNPKIGYKHRTAFSWPTHTSFRRLHTTRHRACTLPRRCCPKLTCDAALVECSARSTGGVQALSSLSERSLPFPLSSASRPESTIATFAASG